MKSPLQRVIVQLKQGNAGLIYVNNCKIIYLRNTYRSEVERKDPEKIAKTRMERRERSNVLKVIL